jgi:hypothetical protein
MTVASFAVVLYRKPLARWLAPRMRYGRNSPDVERLYERSMLLSGIGIAVVSVAGLYVAVVVGPRLDRTLADIISTSPPCETASGSRI